MSTDTAPSSPILPKKGPGRPPSTKNVVEKDLPDDYSEPVSVFPSLLPQPPIVKKKSGRPRKNPPDVHRRSSSPQSTPTKRSRGRPPKKGTAAITREAQNPENQVSLSRKRGRPKKNISAVETLKEEEHEEDWEHDEEEDHEEEHVEEEEEDGGAEAEDDNKTKLLKLISGVKEAVHQLKPHVISLSIPDATAALNSLEVLVDL